MLTIVQIVSFNTEKTTTEANLKNHYKFVIFIQRVHENQIEMNNNILCSNSLPSLWFVQCKTPFSLKIHSLRMGDIIFIYSSHKITSITYPHTKNSPNYREYPIHLTQITCQQRNLHFKLSVKIKSVN